MNILVIPTTDWIRHPFPNRLNFIFDILAERHSVHVLHFELSRFRDNPPRETRCNLHKAGSVQAGDPSVYYLKSALVHWQAIQRVIREEGIEVILSANIMPSFLASLTGVPVVFDYLDHLEESASIYYPGSIRGEAVKRGVRMITRHNLRQAREVITVTNELRDFLQGLGVTSVEVIPNGVDTTLLQPMDMSEAKRALGLRGPVIGYVGSLEYWVDLEMVVGALPNLDVTLLVVGPGLFTDYGERIQGEARSLGVADRVVFTGAVPYAQLGRYISAMDIGLNPLKMMKKNEYAAGGKIFNYLSCGRPVLSSRMISLERLLGDGLRYYDDQESFVSNVRSMLSKPEEPEKNRAIAERFDWRSLAKQYEAVLTRAKTTRVIS
ncbi:MAG: D-inositol-3-phosphate glycosyltransferase [Methanosaeta sp. PtaB.Bin039]|nr:MAG: D-inositol-3-phosphate glycosyltransferase [Methanosaeta sp. PtaB.Bin039]HOT06003.1 glycosyltransferase [Methanotrichaceae archaeon]HQF16793.1 glycosyltransferase [Methanotrichaceae archaeon]HQI90119.1 glycosyltransferase [Methanotrichaceae archaeon]HQJ27858.1 glycosyltransferase [Methanotrichaceae archaeon]